MAVYLKELLVADVLGLKERSYHMGGVILYLYKDSSRRQCNTKHPASL